MPHNFLIIFIRRLKVIYFSTSSIFFQVKDDGALIGAAWANAAKEIAVVMAIALGIIAIAY